MTADHHLRIIERKVKPGAILDVGCGEGYFLQAAQRRGWRDRHGIDVAEAAVRLTAAVATVRRGALSNVRLPSSTFDVVTFFDSFEHTSTPMQDLRETARVLKPGGWVYLVTPDIGSWIARLMGRRWYQFKPNEHICLYSKRTLSAALAQAGFVDVTCRPAQKFLTLEFVATILGSTNPTLSRILEGLLGRTVMWRRAHAWPTGDVAVMARRSPSV